MIIPSRPRSPEIGSCEFQFDKLSLSRDDGELHKIISNMACWRRFLCASCPKGTSGTSWAAEPVRAHYGGAGHRGGKGVCARAGHADRAPEAVLTASVCGRQYPCRYGGAERFVGVCGAAAAQGPISRRQRSGTLQTWFDKQQEILRGRVLVSVLTGALTGDWYTYRTWFSRCIQSICSQGRGIWCSIGRS